MLNVQLEQTITNFKQLKKSAGYEYLTENVPTMDTN